MENKKIIIDLSEVNIVKIIEKLGNANLVMGSQLYDKFKNDKDVVSIKEAAVKQIKDYDSLANEKPGLAILTVVLSIRNNYAKNVEPRVKRLRSDNRINTINDLKNALLDKEAFFKYIKYHSDKKYDILLNIVSSIEKNLYPVYGVDKSEYEVINNWAQNVNLNKLTEDPLRVKNFSVASIQHLRMIFGVNTSKPDQRVLEVFKNEFDLNLSQLKAILAIEEIAVVYNCEPLLIDQIFVNYGSGYYQKTNAKKK